MLSRIPGFSNLELIGSGSFSNVYRALCERSYNVVALKAIAKFNYPDFVINKELDLHRSLDHPFIAQYYGHVNLPDQTVLIMEYVKGYTLLSTVNDGGCLKELEAQWLFCQIVSAVMYIHRRGLVHRDLKLENVMVTFKRHVKLVDFGLTVPAADTFAAPSASVPYASPEVLSGEMATPKADVWALGVVLYGMLVGELPFGDGDVDTVGPRVREMEPEYPSTLSPLVVDLLTMMLRKDASERPDIDTLARHPWVRSSKAAMFLDLNNVCAPAMLVIPPSDEFVDEQVKSDLRSLGFNVSSLSAQQISEGDEEIVMMYRMLRSLNRTHQLQSLLQVTLLTGNGSQPKLSPLDKGLATRKPVPPKTKFKFPCRERRYSCGTRGGVRTLVRTTQFLHQMSRRESTFLLPTML